MVCGNFCGRRISSLDAVAAHNLQRHSRFTYLPPIPNPLHPFLKSLALSLNQLRDSLLGQLQQFIHLLARKR